MKAYDKEFIECMNAFEKYAKASEFIPNLNLSKPTREEREKLPFGIWYNSGETNKLFHAFLAGYQSGLLESRL